MKHNEAGYLDRLFASSSDVTDAAEVAVPLVTAPEGLDERLYAIAESISATKMTQSHVHTNRSMALSWSKITGIAASFLVVIMGFQFYQQQQTLKQLAQAQADLATALHYLGQANRITRSQVLGSLNENMKKAGVEPALEIGRSIVAPSLKSTERNTHTHGRSL